MPAVILVIVACVLLFVLLRGARSTSAADSEDELMRLCLGNREQAERLMALEARNAPGVARAEAARRAVRAFRRDQR
jgi:hypothetical protein